MTDRKARKTATMAAGKEARGVRDLSASGAGAQLSLGGRRGIFSGPSPRLKRHAQPPQSEICVVAGVANPYICGIDAWICLHSSHYASVAGAR